MWKKINRLLLYGSMMIAAIVLLYLLDTRWSAQLDTTEVLASSRQIMPHELIEASDLTVIRVPKDQVVPGALLERDWSLLVGQEALQLIEAGDQFTLNRVDKQSLLKSPDMRIVEIPEKWIASVPGSLRRLDTISIYAIPVEQSYQQSPEGEAKELRTYQKVMDGIVVAYYKDGGANEVQSAITETSNPNVRDYANVRGRRLELQLNDQQLEELTTYVDQGYQFVIGYGNGEEDAS